MLPPLTTTSTPLPQTMSQSYPLPRGLHPIPTPLLDLRSDSLIDQTLLNPPPITSSEKNIWFFWHQGFPKMHPYTQRNIRSWHRRFSPQGWTIRVLDRVPDSPLNVSNFLDIHDPSIFPRAFIDGRIGGDFAPQHTSDLVRWPLLIKYGGVYADVGLMQIGDLEKLWNQTIGDKASGIEVVSYDSAGGTYRSLTNYFLASGRNNALWIRCQKLLLELWGRDGGKTETTGMHADGLVKDVPLMGEETLKITEKDGSFVEGKEAMEMLTDYIIQGQAMTLVMGLVDEEDGWDGPKYVAEHVYAMEFMVGAQYINELTAWDGKRAFELMSLSLPKQGETESEDQKKAREIVELCLSRSFAFKLAHGLVIKALGPTLGSLWRENEGSDDVPGTYAHWLRYGMTYWTQETVPAAQKFPLFKPLKVGPLLRES